MRRRADDAGPRQPPAVRREEREHPRDDDAAASGEDATASREPAGDAGVAGEPALPPLDDDHALGGDDRDDRRGRHAPDAMPPGADEEERRLLRIVLGEDALDHPALASPEGKPNAVREPVARDRALRVEAPALAQSYSHRWSGSPAGRGAKLRA